MHSRAYLDVDMAERYLEETTVLGEENRAVVATAMVVLACRQRDGFAVCPTEVEVLPPLRMGDKEGAFRILV